MPVTTIRLSVAEKRRFTAEARRLGLSLSEYLRQAAQARAKQTDWKTFFSGIPAVTLPEGSPRDLSSREGFAH
ncbi:MAG: plasmid mobilization protein [Verrucomicrobiota bacterium]